MIAVLDYGVGNLFSVEKALVSLGAAVKVTAEADDLRAADKLVLPGVGAFGDCMHNFEATGLIPVLHEVLDAGKPLLGICVGLQILFEGSEESPDVPGLGLELVADPSAAREDRPVPGALRKALCLFCPQLSRRAGGSCHHHVADGVRRTAHGLCGKGQYPGDAVSS